MLKEINNGIIIKIIDYGLSKLISTLTCKEQCGTMVYLAPEMVLNEDYDYSIDIWGVGVIVWYLLYKKLPCTGKDDSDIANQIINSDIDIPRILNIQKIV
jgi:serine/threonine protein kinase